MQITADEIVVLEVSMSMNEREMTVHSTLLWNGKNVILVDKGFLGMVLVNQAEMGKDRDFL